MRENKTFVTMDDNNKVKGIRYFSEKVSGEIEVLSDVSVGQILQEDGTFKDDPKDIHVSEIYIRLSELNKLKKDYDFGQLTEAKWIKVKEEYASLNIELKTLE